MTPNPDTDKPAVKSATIKLSSMYGSWRWQRKEAEFYIMTCVKPKARGPVDLEGEMQMIPNVQEVRNLEPEGHENVSPQDLQLS